MQVKDFKTYLHHFDEFLLIFIDTITWRSRVLWSSTKLTTPKWSILGKREKYGGICGGIEDPYKRNVIDQCSQGDTNTRVLWIHGSSMARCMMIFRSKKIYTCNSKGRIKKKSEIHLWSPWHETSAIGKVIFLAFRAYEERPKSSPYAIWASNIVHAAPGLWGRLELDMDWDSNLIWTPLLAF